MARTTYHHGDARNALLAAAFDLLERVGAAGLSLRQIAERAELSRQAPYNHFADKEALLAELVRVGFERLGAATAAAMTRKGDPLEHAGAAYIAFAQTSPALFRLMFSRELVDHKGHPEARAASASAYGRLAAIVAAIAPPERAAALTLAAWCMVHGYATLCLELGLEGPSRRLERARQFTAIIRKSVETS